MHTKTQKHKNTKTQKQKHKNTKTQNTKTQDGPKTTDEKKRKEALG
jgi:hypothetical protein